MENQFQFILFEGISGSGKSTIAEKLYHFLSSFMPTRVILNAEPTKWNSFGECIKMLIEGRLESDKVNKEIFLRELDHLLNEVARESGEIGLIPGFLKSLKDAANRVEENKQLTEEQFQFIYILDRFQDLNFIEKKINEGKVVIQDRYDLSTLAYGASRGLSVEKLHLMHKDVLGARYLNFVPDITFYIMLDPQIAIQRLAGSGKAIDRFEKKINSMNRIFDAYQEICEKRMKEGQKIVILNGEKNPCEIFNEVKENLEI